MVLTFVFTTASHAATTTPAHTLSLKVTFPKGAAGSLLPSKTLYTPCLPPLPPAGTGTVAPNADQLSVILTGKNVGPAYDLYFFIVNSSASGANNTSLLYNQFYVLKRYDHFNITQAAPGKLPGVQLFLQATSQTLDASQVLLRSDDFNALGTGDINETILQGAFSLDGWGISQGIFVAVAVLVNASANGLSTQKNENQFYFFARNIDWNEVDTEKYLKGLTISRRLSSVFYKVPKSVTGVEDITLDAYMAPSDFKSTKIDETIYRNTITFTNAGLPKGLWMAVAFLADPTKPDFNIDDPKTWSAWDAVPIMFGIPWRTASNSICGS